MLRLMKAGNGQMSFGIIEVAGYWLKDGSVEGRVLPGTCFLSRTLRVATMALLAQDAFDDEPQVQGHARIVSAAMRKPRFGPRIQMIRCLHSDPR